MTQANTIKYPLLFTLCISLSAFMAGVDLMIMSVAIDPMRKALAANVVTAQWFKKAVFLFLAAITLKDFCPMRSVTLILLGSSARRFMQKAYLDLELRRMSWNRSEHLSSSCRRSK